MAPTVLFHQKAGNIEMNTLSSEQRSTLLQVAEDAIEHQLTEQRPLPVETDRYEPQLQLPRATFVTLQLLGQLRGCIGILEAQRPLVADVAFNARAAAFEDPRFSAVTFEELNRLEIHISVLSPAEEIHFDSERSLQSQLRIGIDGVILEERGIHRGTFLPSVWDQLPTAESFLRHLKQKAGLPSDYWSGSLRAFRYTTESFGPD